MSRQTPPGSSYRLAFATVPILLVVMLAGCAGGQSTQPSGTRADSAALAKPQVFSHQSAALNLRLSRVLGAEDPGSLIEAPGWLEYQLVLENTGSRPLTLHGIKLLTRSGRYLRAAEDYAEIRLPPEASSELAEDVAVRSAGIAAGQLIPFGGSIVGLLSSAAKYSEAQTQQEAAAIFSARRMSDVELAPGGKVRGSAFLPRVRNPEALVIDWGRDDDDRRRLEIPLGGTRAHAHGEGDLAK